jgi:hypothetical protein
MVAKCLRRSLGSEDVVHPDTSPAVPRDRLVRELIYDARGAGTD